MNEVLHFAIVGCGMISRFHYEAITRLTEAALTGVYDNVLDLAEKCAMEWGCRAYVSLEDLLDDKNVDAVCICTPSGLHAAAAKKALLAGKHVLIEKPMALTVKDCDELINLSKEKKVTLGTVSQLLYSPSVKKVKQAVDDGILGKIHRADLYMKYYRSQEYYDAGKWRGTWEMDGGGALMNQGIHGITLLYYIMGGISSIYALSKTISRRIEVEDTLSAIVEFKKGAIGVIQSSAADYPGFPRRLEINGERGSIALSEDAVIQWSVQGMTDNQDHISPESLTKSYADPARMDTAGHTAQLKNFVRAVRGEELLLVDGAAGRAAVEIVLSAYESASLKLPVYLA